MPSRPIPPASSRTASAAPAVLAGGILVLVAADYRAGPAAVGRRRCAGRRALGPAYGTDAQGCWPRLVADTAPAELRGTAYGFFNLLGGLAMLAASIIARQLWDIAGAAGNVPGRRRLCTGRAGGVVDGPWQDRRQGRCEPVDPVGPDFDRSWRQRVAFGFSCKQLNLRPFEHLTR